MLYNNRFVTLAFETTSSTTDMLCFLQLTTGRSLCRAKMSGDENMPTIKSTHSLVAKYVTGPIWEKLSMVKTKVKAFI